jgi:methyl-accepting chemotaxis protein
MSIAQQEEATHNISDDSRDWTDKNRFSCIEMLSAMQQMGTEIAGAVTRIPSSFPSSSFNKQECSRSIGMQCKSTKTVIDKFSVASKTKIGRIVSRPTDAS